MYEQPPNSRNATKFSGDTSFYLVYGSENFPIPYVTHNRCFRFCESRKLVVFSEFVGGCQKIRFNVVEKIRRTKYRCDRLLCTDFGVYVKSEQFFTRTWRVQQTRNKQTSPPTPPIVVETIRSESENIEIGWDKYDLKACFTALERITVELVFWQNKKRTGTRWNRLTVVRKNIPSDANRSFTHGVRIFKVVSFFFFGRAQSRSVVFWFFFRCFFANQNHVRLGGRPIPFWARENADGNSPNKRATNTLTCFKYHFKTDQYGDG